MVKFTAKAVVVNEIFNNPTPNRHKRHLKVEFLWKENQHAANIKDIDYLSA